MHSAPYLEGIRENSRSIAVNTGGYIFMFGCLFTAAILFLGAVAVVPFDPIVIAAIVFFCFGVVAFTAGLWFLFQGAGQAKRVVEKGISYLDRELEHRFPTPEVPELPAPALPALPAESETFHYTRNGVGEDVPKNLLHGFDPRMVRWLCEYLAGRNRFSEAALENMPVPYADPPVNFGKAEPGTVYQAFFGTEHGILIRAGIVVGREPKKSGTLAMLLASEMMAAIRNLPEA